MNRMSFREAVKKVHPDINPGIVDVGSKMNTLTVYKNNPKMIYLSMKKWGLIGISNNGVSSTQQDEWMKVETLKSNSIYNGCVVVRQYGGYVYYHVLRTTNKRAYFMNNSYNRKFCHVNSIAEAWIKKEV